MLDKSKWEAVHFHLELFQMKNKYNYVKIIFLYENWSTTLTNVQNTYVACRQSFRYKCLYNVGPIY